MAYKTYKMCCALDTCPYQNCEMQEGAPPISAPGTNSHVNRCIHLNKLKIKCCLRYCFKYNTVPPKSLFYFGYKWGNFPINPHVRLLNGLSICLCVEVS